MSLCYVCLGRDSSIYWVHLLLQASDKEAGAVQLIDYVGVDNEHLQKSLVGFSL